LTDGHPGNTSQSIGLVQALNLPYDVKDLQFTSLLHIHDVLFGTFGASRLGLNKTRSAPLTPPWPDLIIATGWRTAHVSRWVRKQSRGATRLIQLGRKGGHVATFFDVVVSCSYFHLPPHPRRIETVAPLTGISAERLRQAAEPWRELFDPTPCPRIALLVGGPSRLYHFDAETAQRMGEAVRDMVQAVGGSVFVTTSRRTGTANVEALRRGLGDVSYMHQWQPGQQDNPYLAYLALADVLVVTGDSESMLAEAVSTGKPVYIYPLPERRPNLRTRLRKWVFTQARKPRLNQRGTIRHQRGLAYLCARLIERGMVIPPHDLDALHQTLIRRGTARFFGEPLDADARPAWREVDDVARRVRDLVGIGNERDA
ncbi:MAG: mitochondrial fission ELM1 family protein, partial [bacterium]|nr:mitochondrial fission ELM1 family protein [bacterium]